MEQAIGVLLVLFVLGDVFLTVLYARIGTGIFSAAVARLAWKLFGWASKLFGRNRGIAVSFCGPTILVLLFLTWAVALTCGTALIIQPVLGTSVRASNGETPADFITAIYVGGNNMAIVGSSDFAPKTGLYRMLYLFNSLVGMSVLSLTLTYLMQVYSALQHRNVLALKTHYLAAGTGDAAELIAGLGPCGNFSAGYTNLADLSAEMTSVKESHHFYPVLFFFRFRDPRYSVSRFTLVALDTVSLIRSALNSQQYGWLQESASVTQLWQVSTVLVTTLEATFLPGGLADREPPVDEEAHDRWRHRYAAALRRLRRAGIQTVSERDEKAGAELYISLRSQWDRRVRTLAPSMAYSIEEIDLVSGKPCPGA